MLHAAEVRLGRVGKEPVGALRGHVDAALAQGVPVEAKVGFAYRYVRDRRPFAMGELADAVDGVVIVVAQQVDAAGPEGIGLADQSQRPGGVRREDDVVLAARR